MITMSAKAIEVDSFKQTVQDSNQDWMILFWGQGCRPCDNIKPIFDQFSEEKKGEIRFASLKAGENHKLAGHFKIMAVPSLVYLRKDGTSSVKFTGPKSKEDLETFLKVGQTNVNQ